MGTFFYFVYLIGSNSLKNLSSDVWSPYKTFGLWAWMGSFTPSMIHFSYSAFWSSSEENRIQSILLWNPVCLSNLCLCEIQCTFVHGQTVQNALSANSRLGTFPDKSHRGRVLVCSSRNAPRCQSHHLYCVYFTTMKIIIETSKDWINVAYIIFTLWKIRYCKDISSS